MSLVVGDPGRGIRASLKEAGLSPVDDAAAIDLAVQEGVTGTGEVGRGIGLATVTEQAAALGGRVVIHSLSGLLRWPGGGNSSKVEPFPGSIVGVSVPCRPGSKV